MRRIKYIIESSNVPSTDVLWIYKGVAKYYSNGKWTSLGGSTSVSWGDISGKPEFSQVAITGSYNDLKDKPTDATITTSGFMSSTDKVKLNGIAENANNYVHPTTTGNKHIPSGGSSGQILVWSSDGTASWGNPTTYSVATTSANGLMSKEDKAKLNGIATNANNYTLPAASTSIGGVKIATAVADTDATEAATAQTVATTLNELLAALRTSGVLTA